MKIDRLISIIMMLLDKKRIGADELAETFEVSKRTIYRDIDTINLAGIPVVSISGVGGGFEIMPEYKLDKNVFSSTDLSAILMGLTNVSNMIRGDELINAITKVKSFIPPDRLKDIELKANQILIDLSSWLGNSAVRSHIEIIKSAINENKLLTFEYYDRHASKSTRTVEPYQLVLKANHWYFNGFCLMRNDYRLFRLTRITNLAMNNQIFAPRNYQPPQLEFIGIWETMQTKIRLRIHESIIDNVLDYCTFDSFTLDGDESYLVDFPFVENDYFYNILLSFGDKCECLSPSHIRTELKRKAQKVAELYND